MKTDELIQKLRTESLYKDKAVLEIMDLCMEAAGQLEALQHAVRDGADCDNCQYKTESIIKCGEDMGPCQDCVQDCYCKDCRDHSKWELEEGFKPSITNADRIRAMSDEALAKEILHRWRAETEAGNFEDMSTRWCDMKGGCVSSKGYARPCTQERILSCIKRWLQKPAEEDT